MCLDSLFGGATNEQKSYENRETGFSNDLAADFEQQYKDQQDVIKQYQAETRKIESGNTGPGFGGAENAAYISDIVNQGGAAARNATQAVQDRTAGQMFDSSGLARASAIRQQVAGDIASRVGVNTANALTAETAANYEQGRTNATEAAGLLSRQVNMYDPLAYQKASSGASLNAANMSRTIQQENQQALMGKIGFGIKLAGMAAGGIASGFAGGGGLMDTLKGIAGGVQGDSGMYLSDPRASGSSSGRFYGTSDYGPSSVGGPGMQDVSNAPVF
jgi:hypothetical protein